MTNLMVQGRWWLYDWIFDKLDINELVEFRTIVFDRWCWETGEPQDFYLLVAIETELDRREIMSKRQHSFGFRGKTKHLLEDEEFVRTFDANYQRQRNSESVENCDNNSRVDDTGPTGSTSSRNKD